jgi:GYF domain 2
VADQWFYASNGQQWGPVSSASLREMAACGVLQPDDLVWTQGMSHWAPASFARGVFPTRAPIQAPVSSAGSECEEGENRPKQDQPPKETAGTFPVPDLRRGGESPQAPGKTVLIGGMISILGLAFLVAIAAVAKVGTSGDGRSYSVNLLFEGQEDARSIHFRQNERVHITVTTHEWNCFDEPDVDLFVIDPEGNLVEQDIRPVKDCDVSFVAPETGYYQIVVVLDSGNGVRCTVRY